MNRLHTLINSNNRLLADGETGSQLVHALDYASRGWHIFPVSPKGKPHVLDVLNKASTDPKIIARWWKKYPFANIGVLTGPKSGFWVMEVDNLQDFIYDLPESYGPPTYEPHHLIALALHGQAQMYFQWDEALPLISSYDSFEGITVTGNGGYVIAPPSYYVDRTNNYFSFKWNPSDIIPIAPDWVKLIAIASLTYPLEYYDKFALSSDPFDYSWLENPDYSYEDRLRRYAYYLKLMDTCLDETFEELQQVVEDLNFPTSKEVMTNILRGLYGFSPNQEVNAQIGEAK